MKLKMLYVHSTKLLIIGVLIAILAGGGGILTGFAEEPLSESAETDFFEALQVITLDEPIEAPDFLLPSVEGNDVKLSDFKGKVLFLNFWATWCPYCRMERPGLQALFDAYKDREFVILSVSIDQSGIDTVKKYVSEHEITFPNLHDHTSEVAGEYGVRGVPSTFFINAKGKAVGGVVGPREWGSTDVQNLVEHLLLQESDLE